jgi:2-C-methyl-D-erythritol 4-phosphate cytidylyltransferase
MISRGLQAARETGAAIAAVPASDTVKVVGSASLVKQTLDRSKLWLVQTPQVFKRELLDKAYEKIRTDVTDDAMLVEQMGIKVKVFQGSSFNIKVTTREDLIMAEAILSRITPHPHLLPQGEKGKAHV